MKNKAKAFFVAAASVAVLIAGCGGGGSGGGLGSPETVNLEGRWRVVQAAVGDASGGQAAPSCSAHGAGQSTSTAGGTR